MKFYKVGGCVRDKMMGVEPKDIDFVVTGATPADMLAQGFEQVGASFPVFLKDGCEYALARTERKTGVGYNGFETLYDPTVTLEEDLRRRDLTINAMAMDIETGQVIDPYGGRRDIELGVLRHTSEAFAEDPVRVLRTARFAARYGFTVADDTVELMKRVVQEIDAVPQERVWAEIEKGLGEREPVKMFDVLQRCNALSTASLLPYAGYDHLALADVTEHHSLSVRFIIIGLGFLVTDYETARIPSREATWSHTFNTLLNRMNQYTNASKADRLYVLEQLRAFNGTDKLFACLEAFQLITRDETTVRAILKDRAAALTVNTAAIAASLKSGEEIKKQIAVARMATMV